MGYESAAKGIGTALIKIGTMIPPPVHATSIETYLNVVPAFSSNDPNTLHPIIIHFVLFWQRKKRKKTHETQNYLVNLFLPYVRI